MVKPEEHAHVRAPQPRMTYPVDPFGGGPGVPVFAAPPPPAKTDKLASWSVVFAFVFAPVGVVLGHLALSRSKRHGRLRNVRAVVGLVLSYTFVVTAVVVSVVWAVVGTRPGAASTAAVPTPTAPSSLATAPPTTAPPGPPEPSVTPAGLQTLVLTGEEVADILKSPGMVVRKTWTATHGPLPGDTFEPGECVGAVFNGLTESYRDSGYRAGYGVDMGEETTGFPHGVSEFVAAFDNAAAARGFAAKTGDQLRGCAGKQLTYVHGGVNGIYAMGTPAQSGDVTSLRSTLENVLDNGRPTDVRSLHVSAVRAVAAKANVVVDVAVIGRDLGDEPTTMVSRILDKIPG
jgi:hypothetical protein